MKDMIRERSIDMNNKKYRKESRIDQRIEIKKSSIHGKGMFAKKTIKKGEVVIVWGGTVVTNNDILTNKYRKQGIIKIKDDIYLADPVDNKKKKDEFLNHSCDSNLGMKDEVNLLARRDILPGEELTIDYSLFAWSDMDKICNCGLVVCRKFIKDDDWKLQDLQKRYRNCFSPFINKKIKN